LLIGADRGDRGDWILSSGRDPSIFLLTRSKKFTAADSSSNQIASGQIVLVNSSQIASGQFVFYGTTNFIDVRKLN
jgi:hypothetical protein